MESNDLSFKVMRLSKPLLCMENRINLENFADARDLFLPNTSCIKPSTVDSAILLANSFGNIYLGEYLNCLFMLSNNLNKPFFQVSLKIELQTSTQRFTLYDNLNEPCASFEPEMRLSHVIRQEIKEIGVHVLVCSVHYKADLQVQEKKFFRKFYKFAVINPLSVKTKVNLCFGKSDLFLEAQIQNVSSDNFCLSQVKFEPTEQFACIDLSVCKPALPKDVAESSSIFGVAELKPEDSRQYLFQLIPKNGKKLVALGKLDIMWTSAMGEPGRLQTSTLNRKITNLPADLEIRLIHTPLKIVLESPFSLKFKLTCNLDNLDLLPQMKLVFASSNAAISVVGLMAPLDISALMEFELSFVALMPGILKLSGFVAYNVETDIKQELEDSFDIFVYRNQVNQSENKPESQ